MSNSDVVLHVRKALNVQQAKTADPRRILDIAYAFWQSKVLFTAVELDLFTKLAQGPTDLGHLPPGSAFINEARVIFSMRWLRLVFSTELPTIIIQTVQKLRPI